MPLLQTRCWTNHSLKSINFHYHYNCKRHCFYTQEFTAFNFVLQHSRFPRICFQSQTIGRTFFIYIIWYLQNCPLKILLLNNTYYQFVYNSELYIGVLQLLSSKSNIWLKNFTKSLSFRFHPSILRHSHKHLFQEQRSLSHRVSTGIKSSRNKNVASISTQVFILPLFQKRPITSWY